MGGVWFETGGARRRKIRSTYRGTKRDFLHLILDEHFRMKDVYPGERTFYLMEARRTGGPVADFAAGGGRISIPLALAGFDVYAVEVSDAGILAAEEAIRRWYPKARARVHLLKQDIRRARLPVKVKLAIVPFHSFWYNFRSTFFCFRDRKKIPWRHIERQRRRHALLQAEYCLRSIVNTLVPHGRFIIDGPLDVSSPKNYLGYNYREWWDAMSDEYRFRYSIITPYQCRNCYPEERAHKCLGPPKDYVLVADLL